MSDVVTYSKVQLNVLVDDDSLLTPYEGAINYEAQSNSPTAVMHLIERIGAVSKTFTTSWLTSVQSLLVRSLATSTERLTVTFNNAAASRAHYLYAGEILYVPDMVAANNLAIVSDTADTPVEVVIKGTI